MEEITSFEQARERVRRNIIIVDAEKSIITNNSRIVFKGENNILFIEDGVCLKNSTIIFHGNHSAVYLSKNRHDYLLRISIYHTSALYIGDDCYMNGVITLIASERQNILIGRDGLFSFGIFVRTADPHLLYDCETKKRINTSKSVLIGDHVWIGQDALILKGTWIGSGSIIGGHAVLAGKRVASNVAVCGNPAKTVRENVFFSSECTHEWTETMTKKYAVMDSGQYVYFSGGGVKSLKQIDTILKDSSTASQKLRQIQNLLVNNKDRNRFAIRDVKKNNL